MIPDYQAIMLPLLSSCSDEKERATSDIVLALVGEFRLTDEERRHLLPSGRQATFDNRVTWAITYLTQARLLDRPTRGRIRITVRGLEILAEGPPRIDRNYLMKFPEFQEFWTKSTGRVPRTEAAVVETPEETLETSYQTLRESLIQDLLDRVKRCPSSFFEQLVVDLLVSMGYGGSRRDAGQAVGQAGDGGIDGIIKEDRLGLDVVYIQAKRWQNTVGSVTVREFAGSLEGHRAQKGVLITTSQFTKDALDFVERVGKKIILIDGTALAGFMIDFNVGVTSVSSYEIKKMDLDYFPEIGSATPDLENNTAC